VQQLKKRIQLTAQDIADQDEDACRNIGIHGEPLIKNNMKILTHCNAGWLAFVNWGTALAPVYESVRVGKKVFVWVDETRPRCQGSRLTAWELAQEGIPHTIIVDNAAGYYMQRGEIDLVIVGADRVAANGDVVNKIGTYEKAVLAKENGIPFYVAAPTTTFDLNCKSGKDVIIEERSADEVLYIQGYLYNKNDNKNKLGSVRIAPYKSKAKNPGFDITPAKYITKIITEKGLVDANQTAIKELMNLRNCCSTTRPSR
jgi:S-methyl-5-thioribose-1-phosphate isomerase